MPLIKGMASKPPIFDISQYSKEQIIEALNCPVNRHCTRVEHKCDDWTLQEHPEWLIRHFVENGGAVAFAQKRKEFIRLCDHINKCSFADVCTLSKIASGWIHCPIRDIGEVCRECKTALKVITEVAVAEPSETPK